MTSIQFSSTFPSKWFRGGAARFHPRGHWGQLHHQGPTMLLKQSKVEVYLTSNKLYGRHGVTKLYFEWHYIFCSFV